jgi:hypothetical protein
MVKIQLFTRVMFTDTATKNPCAHGKENRGSEVLLLIAVE